MYTHTPVHWNSYTERDQHHANTWPSCMCVDRSCWSCVFNFWIHDSKINDLEKHRNIALAMKKECFLSYGSLEKVNHSLFSFSGKFICALFARQQPESCNNLKINWFSSRVDNLRLGRWALVGLQRTRDRVDQLVLSAHLELYVSVDCRSTTLRIHWQKCFSNFQKYVYMIVYIEKIYT